MNRNNFSGSNRKPGASRSERPRHSVNSRPVQSSNPYPIYPYPPPMYPESHSSMPPFYPPNYFPFVPPEYAGYQQFPPPSQHSEYNRFGNYPQMSHVPYSYPPPTALPHMQSWAPMYLHPPPHSVNEHNTHHSNGPRKEDVIRELEENRLKVEMPCRTLFVRNLGYKADGRKIEAAFAKYGAIKDVSDLIEKRGLMFITFYDIRHSEAAMANLNGEIVENRKLDVHYSLPKQDVNVQGSCTKDNNQGTLLINLVGATEPVIQTDLERLVRVHGDIRRIRDFRNNDLKKFFEFHDSRDCVKAFNALQNSAFKGGKLVVEYAWDLPENIRLAQAQLRGDPLKDSGKRHSSTMSRREYDSYGPSSSSSHPQIHHRRRRSHSRSQSPRRPKPQYESRTDDPILFEDKSGDPQLRDPRLVRPELKAPENTAPNQPTPGNSALFEQMSNLLTILNKPSNPTLQSASDNNSGPSSSEAAQQHAQLLINQKQ